MSAQWRLTYSISSGIENLSIHIFYYLRSYQLCTVQGQVLFQKCFLGPFLVACGTQASAYTGQGTPRAQKQKGKQRHSFFRAFLSSVYKRVANLDLTVKKNSDPILVQSHFSVWTTHCLYVYHTLTHLLFRYTDNENIFNSNVFRQLNFGLGPESTFQYLEHQSVEMKTVGKHQLDCSMFRVV